MIYYSVIIIRQHTMILFFVHNYLIYCYVKNEDAINCKCIAKVAIEPVHIVHV